MSKVIEVPSKEFAAMVKRLDYYKDRVADLEDVVRFLNKQVSEYNAKFAKHKEE